MRKYARNVAKANMKKKGLTKISKKYGGSSFFSKHWREYA